MITAFPSVSLPFLAVPLRSHRTVAISTPEPVGKLPATPLKADTAVNLEAAGAGDVELFFAVPTAKATLQVKIGDSGSCFIDFVPGAKTAACGYNATKTNKAQTDSVPLLGDETYIHMRVLIDGSVAECYWQDGRVAMTVREAGRQAHRHTDTQTHRQAHRHTDTQTQDTLTWLVGHRSSWQHRILRRPACRS
eukprot:SAG22_NODE_4707_length_1185_cov_1.663904_2_plen_193_part_00